MPEINELLQLTEDVEFEVARFNIEAHLKDSTREVESYDLREIAKENEKRRQALEALLPTGVCYVSLEVNKIRQIVEVVIRSTRRSDMGQTKKEAIDDLAKQTTRTLNLAMDYHSILQRGEGDEENKFLEQITSFNELNSVKNAVKKLAQLPEGTLDFKIGEENYQIAPIERVNNTICDVSTISIQAICTDISFGRNVLEAKSSEKNYKLHFPSEKVEEILALYCRPFQVNCTIEKTEENDKTVIGNLLEITTSQGQFEFDD